MTIGMIFRGFIAVPGALEEWRGAWLKSFDHEAFDGRGDLDLTRDPAEAMRFPDHAAALEFVRKVPKCKPLRPDLQPNRPLMASTWELTELPA